MTPPQAQTRAANSALRIALLTICYNEERLMPFFLRHYSPICEKITIYDNMSTDRSVEIAQADPKVEVIPWDTNNEINDWEILKVKNEAWKTNRDHYDWQIVVDMDEFLYHPRLLELLCLYQEHKITVPRTTGFDMISPEFPPDRGQIYDHVRRGTRNDAYSKCVVFSPRDVDINYDLGCHQSFPSGSIVRFSTERALSVLHNKKLSRDYLVKRSTRSDSRRSHANRIHGLGDHFSQLSLTEPTEFEEEWRQAIDVLADGGSKSPLDTVFLPDNVELCPKNAASVGPAHIDIERYRQVFENVQSICSFDKPIHYLDLYQQLLTGHGPRQVNILVLGVQGIGSILLWPGISDRYMALGIHHESIVLPDMPLANRIAIRIGSLTDRAFLDCAISTAFGGEMIDLIIDDASHLYEETVPRLDHLFTNWLRPGGWYVVEDWGCGYWAHWPDGDPSGMSGLPKLIKESVDILARTDRYIDLTAMPEVDPLAPRPEYAEARILPGIAAFRKP